MFYRGMLKPGVNFTNILRGTLLMLFLRPKSINLKCKYKMLRVKLSCEKSLRKMLVKLTTDRNPREPTVCTFFEKKYKQTFWWFSANLWKFILGTWFFDPPTFFLTEPWSYKHKYARTTFNCIGLKCVSSLSLSIL